MNTIVSEDNSQNIKLNDSICYLTTTTKTFSLFCNKEKFSVFHWKSLTNIQQQSILQISLREAIFNTGQLPPLAYVQQ